MARQANTEQKRRAPQFEETLRDGYGKNRAQEPVKVQGPGRVQRARNAGPHSSSTNADGSPYLKSLKKGKTSGGNDGR